MSKSVASAKGRRRCASEPAINLAEATVGINLPVDQRTFTDTEFWAGLNLDLPAMAGVRALHAAGKLAAAETALVGHFRTRKSPRISPFHTDLFWEDWPAMPVTRRADIFLSEKVIVPSEHSVLPIVLSGKPGDPHGIDWQTARGAGMAVTRMRLLAEMVASYARTGNRKYAAGVEWWLRALAEQIPFVLDPGFHSDEYAAFGGHGHEQLDSCYRMFAWGDMLQSRLFLTPGVLSDSFWFWVLKQMWFFHMQFSRFVGAPFRADNHHSMERGVTPYILGVQFPEFAHAVEMEIYSQEIIRRHFDHNVLKDGTCSEHSLSYQYRCFIRFALADSVARLNGRDLLGPVRRRRMQRFLLFQGLACAPDGRQPDVGDGEGTSIDEVVAESGAMYGSPELKAIDQAIGTGKHPVNLAYVTGLQKVKPRLPKELAAVYPIGGHMMLRDGWRRDANFLWMGIKNGSLYNIHTHWDTLSFAISSYGRTLIGDPVGRTFGRMEGLARGYYFSMDAHNGLIVDDDILTSHRALAKWWGGQPPRIDSAFTMFDPRNGIDYASFSHPGYRPLMLRRDVLFVHGRYFLITDGVTMDFHGFNTVFGTLGDIRPHEYIQPLQFEEEVPVSVREKDSALITGLPNGPNLLVVPEPFENLQVTIRRNEYIAALNPPPGECLVGEFRRKTIGKCFFSTVYRPFRGGSSAAPELSVRSLTPRAGPYRQDDFHGVEIRDKARTDYWVVQRNRLKPQYVEVAQAGVTIRTDAAVAFVSIHGRTVSGFQCGGRFVELNGKRMPVTRRALQKQTLK